MVERQAYMDRLIGFQDKHLVKVVTGIRRCGKSTLLAMFQNRLLSQGIPAQRIISVNFEDYDRIELRKPAVLHAFIKGQLQKAGANYVFLDEIQHVKDYADVVDSLFLIPGVDLYITGSNAHFLSGEIATALSGRYIEIRMLPLSLKEYRTFTGAVQDPARLYLDYLRYSSFPYAVELDKDISKIGEYLDAIYSTVVMKDIAARRGISDLMKLESVIRFVFDNIGNFCSPTRISDAMMSNDRGVSRHTIESYLSALVESFVVYRADRFDAKGKQHLKSLSKYYAVDMALRSRLLGNRGADAGRMLENVIYLELLRRGYEVYVGKVDDLEVDFVAMDASGLQYFQVAATVRDSQVLERELKPLQKLKDSYPKRILTLDADPDTDHDGILKTNALDWLLA